MKSTEVRFAILKNLALGPGHGYDLFTILKAEFEIKNASELYKVLRGLKDEGLITQASLETSGGREREILELTPKGFEAYYQELLKASKNFLDLISETAIRRLGEGIVKRLEELEYRTIFETTESVFVHLSIALERQLQLINQVSRHFKKHPVIYIQPGSAEQSSLDLLKVTPRIHVLDRNVTIKPGSIDVAVVFGPIIDTMFDEKSSDNPVVLLKPEGIMIAATLKEDLRAVTPGLLEGIRNVFKDLFDEVVGAKLLENLSELLMSSLFYDRFVSNKDIHTLLVKHFEKVTPLGTAEARLAPLFDAFIAQHLKKPH
jgi:DNA-binding PadR family transcriptional regulator